MARPIHSSYVLQQLNNQREWGFLCDCCIAIDDIYFQAHKAVLAACSSYFRMVFMNHQHTTTQLNLSNMKISAECFDLILQFMYLGKIMTAPANFEQFRIAMSYLQLYNVPECLEDIQDNNNNSSFKCSSSASSSYNSKMVFGVRMYEESVTKNEDESSSLCLEASSTVGTSQDKEPNEIIQLNRFHEQPFNVCKKNIVSKLSNLKEGRPRRFGRSYTCEGCGFVFSCKKLLEEHVLTCTNRNLYQNVKSYSCEEADFNERDSVMSKLSPAQTDSSRIDTSQSLDESSLHLSNTIQSDRVEEGKGSGDRNGIIIKIEPDDNSAVEMDDINIVKISDKGYNESSENEELEDEQDETFYRYYMESQIGEKQNAVTCLKPQMPINPHRNPGKHTRSLNAKDSTVQDDEWNAVCELCELRITEEDLSSHYLSKHIENICACGKCGQILLKGRQLQEHAHSCGAPQDMTINGVGNDEERIDFTDNSENPSAIRDVMFVEMFDDLREDDFQRNSLPDRQLYKHSNCPFRCPNCGQRFETESLVVEHMSHCLDHDMFKSAIPEDSDRDHRRKHFCNLCGKGFYQRCHLREHYTVHTKEKQFVCQTCGKQFLRERQLRLHNDMHKGMARYVCSMCEQGNFRKHDHVRHMISHLSAGETICQVCFQIFPSNEMLEQHMDVHLYTCGVCGAKFNLRKDMRSHYNSKHLKRI
ncbi:zinc finger and BTB domain-containing protein 1 [Microcaecilia unicolor]|uniref:Zinc finger and BTB domain-containing protein 1 n=1 Tax=Microcaecilia unicolor TaxID=1415580 RepID=A0A6P7YRI8_9AMPH|nr:zinc finger and BTB domain-containing protein 1 [Microcaecilia unicolor]XP_030069812.1 zinc finger and BTB domain-containing protein 1 [Microcaecilia unicolor]XP_030069813.1 zinc finger and BTB domain-containing protein 1 [Microcaecilia unicolor]